MEDIVAKNCPACGHAMDAHHGRHCRLCDQNGVECAALEGGTESPGG